MKNFTLFLKYIFLPASLFWMFAQLITVHVPNNPILSYISKLTQIPEADLVLKPFVGQGLNDFDTFMYSSLVYATIAVLSVTSIIFGFLVLGKGRAWIEKLLLLQAFAIPRERINWGKVYDGHTDKPIAFATLRIIQKKDGKEVVVISTVSDLDGRYRMYVQFESGEYVLQVKANGYDDYVQIFNASRSAQNVTVNIPLKPFSAKLYSEGLEKPLFTKDTLYTLLIVYVYFASIITFIHIGYSMFFHFGMVSLFNLIFYGFAAPWNTFVLINRTVSKPGRIVDKYNASPIQSAQVQLFKEGKQISSSISNANGIVQFDAEPGTYEIRLSKQGYALEGSIEESDKFKAAINNQGFLDHNIFMTPMQRDMTATTNLLNPFGS
jgi:5-hydroxyisourate hydrolase-like protein (transthyretin family)